MNSNEDKQFTFCPSIQFREIVNKNNSILGFRKEEPLIWKKEFNSKLIELLSKPLYNPEPRCDLNIQSLWKHQNDLGVIEKIVFTSEQYSHVPAYVCLPANAQPPYTFMICLQGHTEGMHISIGVDPEDEITPLPPKVEDDDFALGCLSRGIAVLCIEQTGFGLRKEVNSNLVTARNCHAPTMQALMLGRTIIGKRIFDIDRGIDYLETRNDVRRIGIMGNSGGGIVSFLSAAVLPRISFAMPSCSFCTFADSWMAIDHCACGYISGILQYGEVWDIVGLAAPKPIVIVAGKHDPIAPVASVQNAFNKLKEIYKAFDAEDKCKLVIGEGGHRFYADIAWPFMIRYLEQME